MTNAEQTVLWMRLGEEANLQGRDASSCMFDALREWLERAEIRRMTSTRLAAIAEQNRRDGR